MTETDKQLVERLRGLEGWPAIIVAAADRIESLSAENACLRRTLQTIADCQIDYAYHPPDESGKRLEYDPYSAARAVLSPNTAEEK